LKQNRKLAKEFNSKDKTFIQKYNKENRKNILNIIKGENKDVDSSANFTYPDYFLEYEDFFFNKFKEKKGLFIIKNLDEKINLLGKEYLFEKAWDGSNSTVLSYCFILIFKFQHFNVSKESLDFDLKVLHKTNNNVNVPKTFQTVLDILSSIFQPILLDLCSKCQNFLYEGR
jgi:hypothetical protein